MGKGTGHDAILVGGDVEMRARSCFGSVLLPAYEPPSLDKPPLRHVATLAFPVQYTNEKIGRAEAGPSFAPHG